MTCQYYQVSDHHSKNAHVDGGGALSDILNRGRSWSRVVSFKPEPINREKRATITFMLF